MKATIRDKRILSLAEVYALLGRGLADQCILVGWLKPCATDASATRPKKVYSMTNVEDCENKIQTGTFPVLNSSREA